MSSILDSFTGEVPEGASVETNGKKGTEKKRTGTIN